MQDLGIRGAPRTGVCIVVHSYAPIPRLCPVGIWARPWACVLILRARPLVDADGTHQGTSRQQGAHVLTSMAHTSPLLAPARTCPGEGRRLHGEDMGLSPLPATAANDITKRVQTPGSSPPGEDDSVLLQGAPCPKPQLRPKLTWPETRILAPSTPGHPASISCMQPNPCLRLCLRDTQPQTRYPCVLAPSGSMCDPKSGLLARSRASGGFLSGSIWTCTAMIYVGARTCEQLHVCWV